MSQSLLLSRAQADDASRLRHPAGRPPEALSDAALVAIGEGLAAGTSRLDCPVPPSGGRAYERLLLTDSYEAWVIVWSAGAVLDLHDHGGATAAVHVVEGALSEGVVDQRDGKSRQRQLTAGTTVTVPPHHAHEVRNVGSVDAISVHVYSPPLEAMTFFDPGDGTLQPKKTERYEPVAAELTKA